MTIDPSRADLETAVLLLVGKAAARALSKEKNRAKPNPDWSRCEALELLRCEVEEAREASANGDIDAYIDELGDVITNAGLALWRAHGGGGE